MNAAKAAAALSPHMTVHRTTVGRYCLDQSRVLVALDGRRLSSRGRFAQHAEWYPCYASCTT
jgi:hypothetical protein